MDLTVFLGVEPPEPAWQGVEQSILFELGPRFEEPEVAKELQLQLGDAFLALARQASEDAAVAADLAALEQLWKSRLLAHAILAMKERDSFTDLLDRVLTEREWELVDRHLDELTRMEDF